MRNNSFAVVRVAEGGKKRKSKGNEVQTNSKMRRKVLDNELQIFFLKYSVNLIARCCEKRDVAD
jgi:hypothetical protein